MVILSKTALVDNLEYKAIKKTKLLRKARNVGKECTNIIDHKKKKSGTNIKSLGYQNPVQQPALKLHV